LAGATEASVDPLAIAGFCRARAVTTKFNEPGKEATASRPFDISRDGFVIAEGAGVVLLEEYEQAKSRNAKIYAEVRGYGMSGEAHHITQPTPQGDGAKRCMAQALWSSGLSLADIDYINAHATSTPVGDVAEINAIKSLFGPHTSKISISSTKGSVGHLMASSGSVEAIFTILAIHHGVIPPTLNLHNVDPAIDNTIDLTPLKAKKRNIIAAMSNSFGFGGTNACLLFSKI